MPLNWYRRRENLATGTAPFITSEAKKATKAALQVAEREALRRRLTSRGIMTNVQPICIAIPSLLFEEPRLRRLVIHFAQQQELGLTKLPRGTGTLGRLKIEHSPHKRVGFMGLVRDALVYASHTATLEIDNVKVDLLGELSHSRLVPVVAGDLAELLRDVLERHSPPACSPSFRSGPT